MKYRCWLLALPICLTACTLSSKFGPITNQESVVQNTMQVGWDGNFYEFPEPAKGQQIDSMAGYRRVRECYFDRESRECREGLRRQAEIADAGYRKIFQGLDQFEFKDCSGEQVGKKRIVIYIHGGLNSREPALERVIDKAPKMMAEGIYPIFINWRSSGPSALKDHYFRIRDGEVSRIAPYTSPIYMVGDGFRTLGYAPLAWWKEGKHALYTSARREQQNDELMSVPDEYKHMLITPGDEDAGSGWRTALWWLTSPIKILTTPLVHSLGKPAWDNMQRRVDTQFVKPLDFIEAETPTRTTMMADESHLIAGTAATLRFISALAQFLGEDEGVRSYPYRPFNGLDCGKSNSPQCPRFPGPQCRPHGIGRHP